MTGSTDATPTVLDRIDFGLRRVERWTALIAGAFVMVITAFGVAEVVMRKLFNAPIFGQIDFVAQSMVPVALLGEPTVYPVPAATVSVTVSSGSTVPSTVGLMVTVAVVAPAGMVTVATLPV